MDEAPLATGNVAMTESELKRRTRSFACDVLKLVDSLPISCSWRIVAGQLGRCATSVGANYRAACRSRSVAEMISKISIVEEEADESGYWLDLIAERQLAPAEELRLLADEANELTAIMVASRHTLQRKLGKAGARVGSEIQNRESKIQNP
jgi:four helix bundle protein